MKTVKSGDVETTPEIRKLMGGLLNLFDESEQKYIEVRYSNPPEGFTARIRNKSKAKMYCRIRWTNSDGSIFARIWSNDHSKALAKLIKDHSKSVKVRCTVEST